MEWEDGRGKQEGVRVRMGRCAINRTAANTRRAHNCYPGNSGSGTPTDRRVASGAGADPDEPTKQAIVVELARRRHAAIGPRGITN